MANGWWLSAIRYWLFAIRYWLFAICHPLFAIRYLLFAICHPLFAIRYLLYAICFQYFMDYVQGVSSQHPDHGLLTDIALIVDEIRHLP
jgi:hypothetical protein